MASSRQHSTATETELYPVHLFWNKNVYFFEKNSHFIRFWKAYIKHWGRRLFRFACWPCRRDTHTSHYRFDTSLANKACHPETERLVRTTCANGTARRCCPWTTCRWSLYWTGPGMANWEWCPRWRLDFSVIQWRTNFPSGSLSLCARFDPQYSPPCICTRTCRPGCWCPRRRRTRREMSPARRTCSLRVALHFCTRLLPAWACPSCSSTIWLVRLAWNKRSLRSGTRTQAQL